MAVAFMVTPAVTRLPAGERRRLNLSALHIAHESATTANDDHAQGNAQHIDCASKTTQES